MGGSTCVKQIQQVEHTGSIVNAYYKVVHDYPTASTYTTNGFNESDISTSIGAVCDQVRKNALTSFDVLTNIAEMKDIPRLVSSVSLDLLKMLRALRMRHGREALKAASNTMPKVLLKSSSKAIRKLGEEWMTYRYGIMPLVYSYDDICKTLNRHKTQTSHASKSISAEPTGVSLPSVGTTYKKVTYDGSVTVRANLFQVWSSGDVARAAGLSFNPLVTAWELIPYSFVADWFVNIGDYITLKTSKYLSQNMWACLSRRDSYTKNTYIHLPNADESVSVANVLPIGWVGSAPPVPPPVVLPNPEGYFLLTEEKVEKYSRQLFDVSDVQLRWNPSLNWRRGTDAAVMTLNNLRSFIGSIRKV